jgi:UDP-glucose:(heptosyl)LPS alpha-1,3-glucosyltransferase
MVKDEILHHFNIAADKLHVIYSGVDMDTFHPGLKTQHRTDLRQRYAIPEDAPLFLFVGSGFERKGLNALLKAMARMPAQSHLLVVGKDKAAARYQQMAIQMGINTRIHFAGGQQDVRPFYGAADAFVLPTMYDPFPNAALEAFACGLPVVTSTKSGAAEFIRNGKNGFVCDALDVTGLTSALNRLADPVYAASLAPKARETVSELTPAQMSGRLLALYETLLGLSGTE